MGKTAVVLGSARSGTSMVAGILDILGVNMNSAPNFGAENPKGCFEDKEIVDLTYQWCEGSLSDEEAISKFIQWVNKRTGDPVWGFKSTWTHYHIDKLLPLLHNPHLVFVVRDLKDNVFAHYYQQIRDNKDKLAELENLPMSEAQKTLYDISFLLKVYCRYQKEYPTFMIHFDQLHSDPVKVATDLAWFLGIPIYRVKDSIIAIQEFVVKNHSYWKGL